MLERVWRKGNPLTLLVGMQTSTATMENSEEIPEKPGNNDCLASSLLIFVFFVFTAFGELVGQY